MASETLRRFGKILWLEIMSRGNSKNVIDGSKSGRAEVMAAISGLAKEVAHLAINTHRPARLSPGEKTEPEVPREIGSLATACGTQPADMAQAENVPLSPQPTQTENVPLSPQSTQTDPEGLAENATGMHVLELYDRLGGFMRPPKSS